MGGFEPPTSSSRTKRATGLRYIPIRFGRTKEKYTIVLTGCQNYQQIRSSPLAFYEMLHINVIFKTLGYNSLTKPPTPISG